jgi:predicted PurR-regulated permease PerM
VTDEQPGRLARLWKAADARNIPLRTIVATVVVVAVAYLAGKLLYRLRDIILLIVVAGFLALLLNPLVVLLQRHPVFRRRGTAVSVVSLLTVVVFFGLVFAFGYPLVNGITALAHGLPAYLAKAEHGQG